MIVYTCYVGHRYIFTTDCNCLSVLSRRTNIILQLSAGKSIVYRLRFHENSFFLRLIESIGLQIDVSVKRSSRWHTELFRRFLLFLQVYIKINSCKIINLIIVVKLLKISEKPQLPSFSLPFCFGVSLVTISRAFHFCPTCACVTRPRVSYPHFVYCWVFCIPKKHAIIFLINIRVSM